MQLYSMIPQSVGKIENIKDLSIIDYFSNYPEQLSKVSYLLKPEDLLNMNFFGINLGAIPSWNLGSYIVADIDIHSYLLLLIPLLSGLTSYISVKYSMKDMPKARGTEMKASMQNNGLTITHNERHNCFYSSCWIRPLLDCWEYLSNFAASVY